LRILHVAAEIYPLVKTGGLADVVAALPVALAARGLDVRVLLPGMPAILNGVSDQKPLIRLGPAFGAAVITLRLGRLPDSGLLAYVIDAPFLYRRDGDPYLGPTVATGMTIIGAMLSSAGLQRIWLPASWIESWQPEVVHAHDWHAGLAPAYIAQNPALNTATVFTIHNLAFRGLFPLDHHTDLGLLITGADQSALEFYGHLSFMKSALVHAKRVNTVSPTYAHEICTPKHGWGLDGLLRDRGGHLSGILNGVDYSVWDPSTDPALPRGYSADKLRGKKVCKLKLQAEMGFAVRGPRRPCSRWSVA
jgi:starch synthase